MEIRFLPHWPVAGAQCLLFVILVAVLGLSMTVVGECLPRKWFRYDARFFRAFSWEKNGAVYNALRVKKWKDLVPDVSKLVPGVYKKKVGSFHDPATSLRLLQETCVAETVHWLLILLSPAFVLCMKPVWGWVCGLLYAAGNLIFVIIQRYNRPRLAMLYARQLRAQQEGRK